MMVFLGSVIHITNSEYSNFNKSYGISEPIAVTYWTKW